MTNDMRLGLLLGVSLVVGAAVVYYNDDQTPTVTVSGEPVVPSSTVIVPVQEPGDPLGNVVEDTRSSI